MKNGIGSIEKWNKRAERYNNISWVTDEALFLLLEQALELTGKEKVLDAGIGTGVFAKYIIDKAGKVFGLDSSIEMLNLIKDERIESRLGDLLDMPYVNDFFDRIIFKNVLHHCIGVSSEIIRQALSVLKPGGKIIICEGIPPSNESISDYSQMLTLHENRVIFTVEDILLRLVDFKDLSAVRLVLKSKSIRNWIDNSIPDLEIRKVVFDQVLNTTSAYKEAANQVNRNGDIFVDMHFLIAKGTK